MKTQEIPMASDREALIAERVVQQVAELPDRTSPDDWPDAMLVTSDELKAIVLAALAAPPSAQDEKCDWTEDEDGIYHTNCGEAFVFTDGAPSDHSMRFCCYCGKSMRGVAYVPPADDDELPLPPPAAGAPKAAQPRHRPMCSSLLTRTGSSGEIESAKYDCDCTPEFNPDDPEQECR